MSSWAPRSCASGLFFPIHQVLLAENGVYILKNLDTGVLAEACSVARLFQIMIAPLPAVGGLAPKGIEGSAMLGQKFAFHPLAGTEVARHAAPFDLELGGG